jgi:anti-sigma regulatory factor (Ser/Thr protein kinase)
MSFRHEALFCAGPDDFVRRAASFLRDAVAAEEPALVVVGATKIGLLREELDDAAGHVYFSDMAAVGANPARIIPAWRDFVSRHAPSGRRLRGIGEPIWPERSAAELAECQRHESLLNLAFAGSPSWWLLCPYDTEALDPAVLEEARRTHPFVVESGVHEESVDYYGLGEIAAPFDEPLPEPQEPTAELVFESGPLDALRWFVARHAADAGFDETRAGDLVLAVHELATNSLRHGGGRGTLRVWREPGALLCEIRDVGRIDDPMVGRVRPSQGRTDGRGLWLANQLCDLVQIRCFRSGSVVRLHMRCPSG